ncbi:MAG: NUMOD3 domain-containing DNA-binding protein [Omnitrophica bacterium]|nr:NUMOD3 domain-containing DNA-binding protein [Candidatus Omnitrophota bacterium]
MIGIYVLENTTNGKLYVGQSTNLKRRVRRHGYRSTRNNKSVIDRAVNKHGWDNFKQYIYYVPEEFLDYFETEMIKRLNSLLPNGYNLKTGGANGRHSEETCRKMSEERKGKKHKPFSAETRVRQSEAKKGNKNPMFDKHHSEETRALQSEAHKGKTFSEETIALMSINHADFRGENHPRWKGDNALPATIRQREKRMVDPTWHERHRARRAEKSVTTI